MPDEQAIRDITRSINEIKGAASELEAALKRGEVTVGLVSSVDDILTRFAIPRLKTVVDAV